MTHPNSFDARATLDVGGRQYTYFKLDPLRALSGSTVDRLPFSLRVLLENLVRGEDGAFVKAADVEGRPAAEGVGVRHAQVSAR